MKFSDILAKYKELEELTEKIQEDEEDEVGFDPEEISASFTYVVENFDNEKPILEVAVKEYNDECLEALAHLIAPMSHPDFFHLVLARLQRDFTVAGRADDFMSLLEQIDKVREVICPDNQPYITPLDLSRRQYE